jgi:hypothetical protein
VSVVPSLAMPTDEHHVLVSRPLIEPVIRRTLGLVQRRENPLSPAAENSESCLYSYGQRKTTARGLASLLSCKP